MSERRNDEGGANKSQEDYLVAYRGVSEREVRIGKVPLAVPVTLIALATLAVLFVVAYTRAHWIIGAFAVLVGLVAGVIVVRYDGKTSEEKRADSAEPGHHP